MKYSIKGIQNQYDIGEKLQYIFFWGHQPDKSGRVTESCLSQWWECSFTIEGKKYCNAEQYMMAEKARLFKDLEIEKEILQVNNPKEIKALGRCIKGFNEELWNTYKYEVVKKGNYHKFEQNAELLTFIVNSENKILVEASPYDKVWGIEMSVQEPGVENPSNWKGENLLGFALMEVRDKLIKDAKSNLADTRNVIVK